MNVATFRCENALSVQCTRLFLDKGKTARSVLVLGGAMSAYLCSKCGADLPAPERYGCSWCDKRKSAGELLSAVELVASSSRIMLTDDTVLELLREHISGHVYLAPFV